MAGLDFKRAAELFMGTEGELALALRMDERDVKRLRERPGDASRGVLADMARVLEERGRAMLRVAEMLREAAAEGGNGRGH